MSEYQYYEFCRLGSPLSPEARKEMAALSSRARVGTHSASYVYSYSDFRGDPKKLLLEYFDVFFYISNWGTVQLMFKYLDQEIDSDALKQYSIEDVICFEQYDPYVVLSVEINNEESGDWINGEELLPDLLPLYEEIKSKNYQFLRLASAVHHQLTGEKQNALSSVEGVLSSAQAAFLRSVGIHRKMIA